MADKRGVLAHFQYWTGSQYAPVCGINNMTFRVSNALGQEEKVNCTDRDTVIKALQYYGVQTFSFDYDGLFDSDAAGTIVADAGRDQSYVQGRIYIPGDGYYTGLWAFSQVEWQGATTGGLKHSASAMGHDTITYTAE